MGGIDELELHLVGTWRQLSEIDWVRRGVDPLPSGAIDHDMKMADRRLQLRGLRARDFRVDGKDNHVLHVERQIDIAILEDQETISFGLTSSPARGEAVLVFATII